MMWIFGYMKESKFQRLRQQDEKGKSEKHIVADMCRCLFHRTFLCFSCRCVCAPASYTRSCDDQQEDSFNCKLPDVQPEPDGLQEGLGHKMCLSAVLQENITARVTGCKGQLKVDCCLHDQLQTCCHPSNRWHVTAEAGWTASSQIFHRMSLI